MDPVTITSLATATAVLGKAAIEGAGKKIGEAVVTKAKQYWPKVKALLGFKTDPAPAAIEAVVASHLESKPEAAPELEKLLAEFTQVTGTNLVGSLHVEKGSVNVVQNNSGTISTTNNFH